MTTREEQAIIKSIEDAGLFVAKLNNGDWMVGKASYIYHLDVTQDHYADPNLSISPSLEEAVTKAVRRVRAADHAHFRE